MSSWPRPSTGKTCLTKLAANRAKDFVELRERVDLVTESTGPQ
jgi:hypothetical protein